MSSTSRVSFNNWNSPRFLFINLSVTLVLVSQSSTCRRFRCPVFFFFNWFLNCRHLILCGSGFNEIWSGWWLRRKIIEYLWVVYLGTSLSVNSSMPLLVMAKFSNARYPSSSLSIFWTSGLYFKLNYFTTMERRSCLFSFQSCSACPFRNLEWKGAFLFIYLFFNKSDVLIESKCAYRYKTVVMIIFGWDYCDSRSGPVQCRCGF